MGFDFEYGGMESAGVHGVLGVWDLFAIFESYIYKPGASFSPFFFFEAHGSNNSIDFSEIFFMASDWNQTLVIYFGLNLISMSILLGPNLAAACTSTALG